MKKMVLLSLLTSALFAETSHKISQFDIDSIVKEVSNELGYGKQNTYSLLFAKHSLNSQDEDVHFYYGAKMGFVSEGYAAENGFGVPLNKMGTYYAAAVGVEYDFAERSVFLAEGLRSEDQTKQRSENQVQVTYTYTY